MTLFSTSEGMIDGGWSMERVIGGRVLKFMCGKIWLCPELALLLMLEVALIESTNTNPI